MDTQKFLENFSGQFEEMHLSKFTLDTPFRDIEEWSSLVQLSIIAMADEMYRVKLRGEDFKQSVTIGDICEIVKSRL